MTDRRSIIGQVHFDQYRGPRTAGFSSSENGDGYLSDVQTLNSNNPSEVSQDFHSSARLLEQVFNDKCNFIRDFYDQRSRQLSAVVNKLCEELVSDEVLQEMRSDRTSSAFIPAHLGEVINRHLEDNREQFIHRLISQLSDARSGLSKCKDQEAQRNKYIDSLEPEIIRGRKALSGMDSLQRQLTDLKRQYDQLQQYSQEKIRKLKVTNDQLNQRDTQSREQFQKLLVDLSVKSQAVESLQKDVEEKTRDSCFMESSYDRAVNDEVSMRVSAISTEKKELSVTLGELKSELRVKSDQLVRSQELLKIKEEENNKMKSQTASMMSQVQILLDQESNESNRTIATLHDKMKILKSKLYLESQQERNLTNVLKNEINAVRREKEEKSKEFEKAMNDTQNYQKQISILVTESSAWQIRFQECQTALRNSELDSNKANSKLEGVQQELELSTKLKEQELSVAFSRAKMQAVKELENDRLQLDQEVSKRTETYIKNNENQLKALHNQLRHSYSFGTINSHNISDSINQSVVWGTAGNTAHDLSVLVALRSAEEKANVSKIVLESEFLISKTKSDAKMEITHREKVQKLESILLEASDNISKLREMVLTGRMKEEENNENKVKITQIQKENITLKKDFEKVNSDLLSSEKKLVQFENERILEKKSFIDLQKKLNDVVKMHNEYEKLEIIEKRNKEDLRNIELEKEKINREKLIFHETQIRFEIEKAKTVNMAKNDYQNENEIENLEEMNKRKPSRNICKSKNSIDNGGLDENENENTSSSMKDRQRFRYDESDDFDDKMTSLSAELGEVKSVFKNLQEEHSQYRNKATKVEIQKEREKEKEKEIEKQRILFENYQRLEVDFDDDDEKTDMSKYKELDNDKVQEKNSTEQSEKGKNYTGWDFNGSGYISPDDTEYFHEKKLKYSNRKNGSSEKSKNRLKNESFKYLYEEDNEMKMKKEQELIQEIQELKLLLSASKDQAIADQKQDAHALEAMSKRFDNLMHNYELNVTAVSEKLDTSNAQTIQSEDLLMVKTETIRFLEKELLQKTLLTDSKNLLISELTKKNLQLLTCIQKLKGICKKQFTDLRAKLRKTRESIEDLDPFIDGELRNTIFSLTKMNEILQIKMNEKHENELRKLRETLTENHRIEQESNTTFYVKRFQIQSDENMKKLIMIEKDNEKNRENFTTLLVSRDEEESVGSSAYQSVCMGLLSALECTGLFSNLQVRKILLLVTENLEPNSVILNIAKDILAEKLNTLFLEMKRFKSEVEHFRRELIYNSSDVSEDGRVVDRNNENGLRGENNDDEDGSLNLVCDDIPVPVDPEYDYYDHSDSNDNDDFDGRGEEKEEEEEGVEDVDRGVGGGDVHHQNKGEEEEEGGDLADESLVNISLNSLRT